MELALQPYLLMWRPLGYILVFIGMIFEGDIFLFTAAFLTHQQFFDARAMFLTAFSGVFFGDMFWYWIGVRFNGSSHFLNRWVHKLAKPFDRHLLETPLRAIFFSKFAYGVHHALLVRAGALGIKIRDFMKVDIIATLTWMSIVGGLGYVSSASLGTVKHYLRFTEFAFGLALILLFPLEYIARRISKRKL